MAGHPEYLKLLDELRAMHLAKSSDYGNPDDALANLRASADFGVPPWLATVVRANDKMFRLQAFATSGTLKNESVEDSLLDLASYALLALVLYRENAAP